MKKKKLLIVIHHLTIGGIQKSLVSALNAIDYDKYDVTLYVRKNRTDLLEFINKKTEVIINTDKTKYYRKISSLFLLLAIAFYSLIGSKNRKAQTENRLNEKIRKMQMEYEYRNYMKNRDFDIAVAYSQGFTPQFVDKYVSARKKTAFFHSSTQEQPELYKSISERFDAFGVLNKEQAELVEKWYPKMRGKTVIVENYVDRGFVAGCAKEFNVENPDGCFILCTCGRFAKVKGFDLACKTAKILKDNGIDFLWRFVGDGAERANIEQLVKDLGITDNIEFVGMQKNPYPYIASCDIYVQPSYEEAMPVVIIEAQILNKPVVSTDTLGGRSLIKNGENGVVCKIDEESAACEIMRLLTDKNYYGEIVDNLKNVDHSGDLKNYKKQWDRLLER